MPQTSFLALRICGEFDWPSTNSKPTATVAGSVSIEYRQVDAARDDYEAWVCWSPHVRGRDVEPERPSDKPPEFADDPTSEQPFCTRLSSLGNELRFRGGWLFELFAPFEAPKSSARMALACTEETKKSATLTVSSTKIDLSCSAPEITAVKEFAGDLSARLRVELSLKAKEKLGELKIQLRASPESKTIDVSHGVAKALMSILGQQHQFPAHKKTNLRVSVGPVGARYEIGPLDTDKLSSTGIVRKEFGQLAIAFDDNDRAIVASANSQFYLIATVSWSIGTTEFWETLHANQSKMDFTLDPDVAWYGKTDTISVGRQDTPSFPLRYTPNGLLRGAALSSNRALMSLPRIEGGLLDCTLPSCTPAEFTWVTPPGRFAARLSRIPGKFSPGGSIDKGELTPVLVEARCVSLLAPFTQKDFECDCNVLKFKARLPLIDKSAKTYDLRLRHALPTIVRAGHESRLLFSAEIAELPRGRDEGPRGLVGRVGGMTFLGGQERLLEENGHSLLQIFLPPDERLAHPKDHEDDLHRLRIEWNFSFEIESVIPTRGDLPWGDRETEHLPLLVRKSDAVKAEQNLTTPFRLRAIESISPRDDRHLLCTLNETSADPVITPDTYTLLSRTPWSILRFSRDRLTQMGNEENALIASYDSDERTWLFKRTAAEYRYRFPPQGVGESADKPRVLELHDINASTVDDTGKVTWLRQSDVVSNEGRIEVIRPVPKAGGDLRRSYVVESRYAPSLDIWVNPTDLDQNYLLPEWNAHELFRRQGAFGLGIAIRALRGEFLYGLTVGVDATREPSQARVAEIEALIGKVPQLKYAENHRGLAVELLRRWELVRSALLSRHERLEIWSPAYDQPRPFSPAQFRDGVSFALRTTAHFRSPTPPEAGVARATSQEGRLRISPDQGLSGGAIWPVEFRAFWEAIRDQPASTGGRIERIAISPTGGDADQSANFLKGLVTIASSTRAGFVQRQRVEILGRIGVFWNRAKHVVIYERTVNPSEQFAPEPDTGDTEKWHLSRSRRAVIRKVTEFIELIEPVRGYPDTAVAKDTDNGFLDSSRFQKIIFVDSAWGADVEDPVTKSKGYVIPLWNANAALKRPNVYPFPSINFATHGEGRDARPLVPRQCANPENLYFYAQATPLEPDTNNWQPAYGVDYESLIDPGLSERTFAGGAAGHGAPLIAGDGVPAGRKPSPPRVLPGHHRFTWRLLPDSARTVLNAARGASPVYGNIESFTFSRGTAPAPSGKELDLHLRHAQAIAEISLGPALISSQVADLRKLNEDLTGSPAIAKSQQDLIAKILGDFQSGAESILAAKKNVENLTEAGVKDVLARSGLDQNPLNCGNLAKRLTDDLRRRLMVLAHAIDDRKDELLVWIDQLTDAALKAAWKKLDDPRKGVTRALGEILKASSLLSDLLRDGQSEVNRLLGELESARRVVHDSIADVDRTLARSARRIQDCLSACSSSVEWADDRYDRLHGQVHEELNGLAFELNSVVSDVCQRLAAELGPFGAALGRAVAKLFSAKTAEITDRLNLSISTELSGQKPENLIQDCLDLIQAERNKLERLENELHLHLQSADDAFRKELGGLEEKLRDAAERAFSLAAVGPALASDVTNNLIGQIDEAYRAGKALSAAQLAEFQKSLRASLPRLGDLLVNNQTLNTAQQELQTNLTELCDALTKKFNDLFGDMIPKTLAKDVKDCVDKLNVVYQALKDAKDDVKKIKLAIENIETECKNVGAKWRESISVAQTYSTRVMEGFSRVAHSSVKTAPSNVLKLMAAATAAPEIGQLQANVDRLRCAYQNVGVQISNIRATFAKLGDALKALGIDIPANGLSEKFEIPQDILKNYDISRLFPNFGGLNLRGLFPDVKVPQGVQDAVKVSHEFDRKQFRAWVQIDVKVPIDGRKELYSFGPFAVYFRDTLLQGVLRAEASKDTDETQTTARAWIDTHIDVDIGGERVLSLEKVRISYAQGDGLKFEFDPKSIRLHAALQFVQDTLGDLFGDEIGGLKIVKERGIPIGIEHAFALPTISLMSGTTGISNIQMSNLFRLVAYPQFVLTNQFNLSKPELPFLFSFFIVGGTGYILIDASYRPLDQALTVGVEVAIGGSAALGFAFGPVRGAVFVALSVAITYRKAIRGGEATGEGLTVSLVLVIAGNVSLWGIIDVYLGLLLRMSYQESGAIDGLGSLTVSVKICCFVTLRFSTTVQYRLKNGRSEKTVTSTTSVTPGERIQRLKERADRLHGARA